MTVSGFDSGTYTLMFQNGATTFTSGQISSTAGTWPFFSAVGSYYQKVAGANINVGLVLYDASGNVVQDFGHAVKAVYTITVLKSIT